MHFLTFLAASASLALAAPHARHHDKPHGTPVRPVASSGELPSGTAILPTGTGSLPSGTGILPTGTGSWPTGTAVSTSTPRDVNNTANAPSLWGINESGPEFGEANIPGTYNKDYIWPNLTSLSTFTSKGLNTFRVNIMMERLVPNSMTGSLDTYYFGNLTQTVNAITQAGGYAMIVPHNYGRYNGQVMSSTSDFKKFWQTVATPFKSNDRVIFDTNNEYHDMSSTVVAQLNQAAIDGIRAAGATSQWITVEGNAWTGAWTWTTATGTDGKTNAQTMGNLTDPSSKLIYQMHQYLDSDGSGTSTTCVSATIGSERLKAATNWLRDNGKVGVIGEFAGAVNNVCESAIKDMLAYIKANDDVWTGALWWAAGPWWGTYMFSVEPKDGPAFSTYVPILQQYAS